MDTTLQILNAADLSTAVLEVPQEDGCFYPFSASGLTVSKNGLLFPLESERTEAGKGLVRALWFGQKVILWADGLRCVIRPQRCHIVGALFSARYRQAKDADPNAEVAAVWELEIIQAEQTDTPAPAPKPLHHTGRPEYHLDHPALHK